MFSWPNRYITLRTSLSAILNSYCTRLLSLGQSDIWVCTYFISSWQLLIDSFMFSWSIRYITQHTSVSAILSSYCTRLLSLGQLDIWVCTFLYQQLTTPNTLIYYRYITRRTSFSAVLNPYCTCLLSLDWSDIWFWTFLYQQLTTPDTQIYFLLINQIYWQLLIYSFMFSWPIRCNTLYLSLSAVDNSYCTRLCSLDLFIFSWPIRFITLYISLSAVDNS